MKFSRIIGKIDPKIISDAQKLMSSVFLELALKFKNEGLKDCIGGDPFLFTLLQPMQHIATLNINTAATDGIRYYWNPYFILSKSRQGLRLVCYHEALHAYYMHPSRRGNRHPKLWNICIDYIVNGIAMQDLVIRKRNPAEYFKQHLGNFLTLENYVKHIKNPFLPLPGIKDFTPEPSDDSIIKIDLPKANEERDLTDEERKELEDLDKTYKYFYADPNLPEDLKNPKKLYDYLYKLLPKCSCCGRIGMYRFPDHKDEEINHDHGYDYCDFDNDYKYDESINHNHYYDIFDSGDLLDDHMDSAETPEKMARRLANAIHNAKNMAGSVPAGMEDELGLLMAPRIKWQDFIRTRLVKSRAGNSKNDWSKFRSRQLFAGLLSPKKKNNVATAGVLLDTSGSMSREDKAIAISQLQSIDEKSELTLTCADAEIYWSKSIKLRNAKKENLQNIKVTGGGGTLFASYFSDYEKHIGKCDFLIILTDGYLMDTDIAAMKNPGIPVYWIITNEAAFNAPFGKCFNLHD